MTKKIRIENADTGTSYKVRAYTEDLVNGVWVRNPGSIELDYPTALQDAYIHSTRRIVVEELVE